MNHAVRLAGASRTAAISDAYLTAPIRRIFRVVQSDICMAKRSRVLLSSGSGQCRICGGVYTATGMTSHIKKHIARTKDTAGYYVIRIDAGRGNPFWMYVAAAADITFDELDQFLRSMWLDCCGHPSHFVVHNKTQHEFIPDMDVSISDVLRDRTVLAHYYDSTVLRLGVVRMCGQIYAGVDDPGADERFDNVPTKYNITVLALHDRVQFRCRNCRRESATVCAGFTMTGEGVLCMDCARLHDHAIENMRWALQSPRSGRCRYGMIDEGDQV